MIDPGQPGGYGITKTCLHRIKPRDAEGKAPPDATEYEQDSDYDQAFEAGTIAPILAQVESPESADRIR